MKKMLNKIRNSKGFTLMEMIVVIAIIGILIGIIVPNVAKVIGQAKDTANGANAKNAYTACATWMTNGYGNGLTFAPATGNVNKWDAVILVPQSGTAPNVTPAVTSAVVKLSAAVGDNGEAVFTGDNPLVGVNSDLSVQAFKGGNAAYLYYTNDYTALGLILVDGSNRVISTQGTTPPALTVGKVTNNGIAAV